MRIEIALPGHEGAVARRLADGSLLAESTEPATAYRAICSCGWTGPADLPPTEHGLVLGTSEWTAHMKPHFAAAPPDWMLARSNTLRAAITELTARWPLQSLAVLADVERWQRTLLDEAVAAARAGGASWVEIGQALGITRQSAHERFSSPRRRTKDQGH